MNPFQLQFDLVRQWMGLTTSAMTAGMEAMQAFGRQGGSAMPGPVGGSFPMLPWMANPWQSMQFPMTLPFPGMGAGVGTGMGLPGLGMPGMSMPGMPGLPGLPLAFANPWSFWMAAFAPPSPAQQMVNAWMMPWAAAATFAAPMMQAFFGRPAATALADQVTSNYRTASGFASAAIVQPFDPRSYTGAWWPMGGNRYH